MKTHYATVERGNESDPLDEWSDPICGTQSEDIVLYNEWSVVDCKKCLNQREKFEAFRKQEMEASCKYMAEFMEFNGVK